MKGVFNMNREIERELWRKAIEIAKEKYELEWGEDTWELQAGKYERQDWVWAEFEVLKAEYENSNNETTNKNLNKRGNDIMMERKMNNTEKRMETLKANGIDTTNFFDLSMRIPFGAEVKILVDGKEIAVPTQTFANTTPIANCGCDNFVLDGRKVEMCNGDLIDSNTGEVVIMGIGNIGINDSGKIGSWTLNGMENDPIVQSIIEDGYVKNSKLFRRFVTAQTFRMLSYQSYKDSTFALLWTRMTILFHLSTF